MTQCLKAGPFGVACGFVWVIGLFILSVAHLACPEWGGAMVRLMQNIYCGYAMTPWGVVIGLLWAFFDAFLGGWLLAFFYNRMVRYSVGA